MAEAWANVAGIDLHVDLSGHRVRSGLEASLRDAIRAGRLRPGTRLPSSRVLAADLGIARNTVAEVYTQLAAAGWLTARTGSGTSVADYRAAGPAAPGPDRRELTRPRYDLRAGQPDLSAFPRRAWLSTARKALNAAPDDLLGYADPRGLPPLRAAVAEYLARARGVVANPDHIVICGGFGHGLAAICRMLRASGASTLAVEEYGHQQHGGIVRAQGLRPLPLPVDTKGAVVAAAQDADAMLLTPAHQFPLGVTLHPQRRRDVADSGRLVIEDDYDGEFRYDRQPVGALQALAPERMIYAGTASKSLAPGVRLGWLVVPPRLIDAVLAELTGGPSALDELTLAEFIKTGGYDRQVRRARLAYRARRDRLAAAVTRLGLSVTGIAAGLHAVLYFSRTTSEDRVLARARDHGLALDGLSRYRMPLAGPAEGNAGGRPVPNGGTARSGHRLRPPARARLHRRAGPARSGAVGRA